MVELAFLTKKEFYFPDAREKFFSSWGRIYSRLLKKPEAGTTQEKVLPGRGLARAVELAGMEDFGSGESGKRILAVYGQGAVGGG